MSNHLVEFSKYGPSSVLQFVKREIPKVSGNKLLVKNAYAGLNYIDTYCRSGVYPVPLPFVSGKEGSGIVTDVGPECNKFKVGDRVVYLTMSGGYAQYNLVSPVLATKIPEGISLKLAAASLLQGLTVLTLVEEAYPVRSGDYVIVHAAAGGVGLLLCQILNRRGVHVIATASTPEKRRLALHNGAEFACSYDEVPEFSRQLTNGKGVHASFDSVGKDTLEISINAIRNGGTFVSYGNASGKIESIPLSMITSKCIKVVRPTLFGYLDSEETFDRYTSKLWEEILKNKLNIAIHHTWKLEEAKEAHDKFQSRATTGKLLLSCNEDLMDA
ncbi:NADPH quinone oxidoreductase/ARE-binding protein [Schizosaccharomyces cryophilus OY26]|uniref:NADPH quinone oxidoreductase/ARE-binding protein n=1 Tax=Schizosaccharomyces cryophilus (strain OY26 / ATCC MYA-4695 / CBS 11777 / NBRC 106824 / NRRL Y48691) TaxID=653667 RepID=S9XE28_SCHCR|nr:NADPH quinone oxidoreductase/ARE-binding protein [Schizosaccharomyces cryophilus OY26]EPY52031.1 NADPH quinone oxidoreductase/ARE-binding protein [Schizosaccharomyces cryophilus OY26]